MRFNKVFQFLAQPFPLWGLKRALWGIGQGIWNQRLQEFPEQVFLNAFMDLEVFGLGKCKFHQALVQEGFPEFCAVGHADAVVEAQGAGDLCVEQVAVLQILEPVIERGGIRGFPGQGSKVGGKGCWQEGGIGAGALDGGGGGRRDRSLCCEGQIIVIAGPLFIHYMAVEQFLYSIFLGLFEKFLIQKPIWNKMTSLKGNHLDLFFMKLIILKVLTKL